MTTISWKRAALLSAVVALLAGSALAARKPGGGGSPPVIAFFHVDFTARNWGSYWGPPSEIRAMDAAGRNLATVSRSDTLDFFDPSFYISFAPRWSPDGQRLLFANLVHKQHALVTTAADGSDLRVLVTSDDVASSVLSNNPLGARADISPFFSSFDWSPDGQWVVFEFAVSYPNGNTSVDRLFLVHVADGVILQLTDGFDAYHDILPRWSRALDTIAFVRESTGYINDGSTSVPNELWVTTPDGNARRRVIGPASGIAIDFDAVANWSNGGDPVTGSSSLAFRSGASLTIVNVNLAGTDPIVGVETIIDPQFALSDPDWSPDDSALVLRRDATGVQQIATFDLATGASNVLLQVDPSLEWLAGPTWRATP